jgi:hypothetical protein
LASRFCAILENRVKTHVKNAEQAGEIGGWPTPSLVRIPPDFARSWKTGSKLMSKMQSKLAKLADGPHHADSEVLIERDLLHLGSR